MAEGDRSVLILIPSFNDWAALRLLLPKIDQAICQLDWRVSILIMNDASTEAMPELGRNLLNLQAISILNLRCNLGHQRAIALGLYHAHEYTDASAVLVMDGDGEDRPEDISHMLADFERGGCQESVFAARSKRMEGPVFQISYQAYRFIHRVLTGMEVRVGNFSVLPRSALSALMVVPDVWNHYAAAVKRSRIPRRQLPLARGVRLEGQSHMNFVSLLIHGLSALSVFSDRVAARLLAASSLLTLAGATVFVWAGWTPASMILLALAAQSLTFSAMFALSIVSRRVSASFLLIRDAQPYIASVTPLPLERGQLRMLNAAVTENTSMAEALHK